MSIRLRSATAATVALTAVALAGCAGEDSPPAVASSLRTADYELARMSTLGLREAFLTLTGRSDGKTTAVVDFYVPRVDGAEDDLYPVSLREGGCASPGKVEHDLGRLSASITVVVLDAPVDQLVEQLETGEASVVIQAPDEKTVAWCGPLPA